jgi:hypothetical protein
MGQASRPKANANARTPLARAKRKSRARVLLLGLAHATRERLEHVIEVLENDTFTDDEAEAFARVVRATHQAAFGNERTRRWLHFVQIVDYVSWRARKATPPRLAARVISLYGEHFPDVAAGLVVRDVDLAIRAWREKVGHFVAIRNALAVALPATPKLPKAAAMSRVWSRRVQRVPTLP